MRGWWVVLGILGEGWAVDGLPSDKHEPWSQTDVQSGKEESKDDIGW